MSFVVMTAVFFVTGALVASSRLPRIMKQLICLGLALRVLGAAFRYWVIFNFYGWGDAYGYYRRGLRYSESFKQLDFSGFIDLARTGDLWGTRFIDVLSGGVLTFLGPGIFPEFLFFSLSAILGLICFVVAFRRSNSGSASYKYLAWLMVFPSLWFWPASVGKEATIMFGIGLAVLGFIGTRKKIHWPMMLAGAALVYAARPELAAVLLGAMLIGEGFSLIGRWTLPRMIQTLVFTIAALYGLRLATSYMGIEEWSTEGLQTYVETDKSRRATGSTNVSAVGVSLLKTPVAVVNVLLRPFPWEVTNIMVFASSLEVVVFMAIVLFRRRNLARSLRYWRSDRLLRLALIFVVLYPIGLGMMVVNLGIIARQRVFLYPFLFALLEADLLENRTKDCRKNDPRVHYGLTLRTPASLTAPGTSLFRMSTSAD